MSKEDTVNNIQANCQDTCMDANQYQIETYMEISWSFLPHLCVQWVHQYYSCKHKDTVAKTQQQQNVPTLAVISFITKLLFEM